MGKSLQEWKNKVLTGSYKIDLDNSSYDCVDVSKDWVEYLTGVKWQNSAGWGNAKDIYAYWSDKYLEKMPAGTAPRLGDIAVMDGSVGGGYGHTGVVIAINGNSIQIAQQNTFTQQAVYTGWWNAYGGYIKYLRPKVAFSEGNVPLAGNQRVVGAGGVHHRDAANRTAHSRRVWPAGEVLDMGGYHKGESVDGNDIWFVGGITGGFLHSSGFTDPSTHDLADLTPVKLQPHQRQIAGDVMNYRNSPELRPENVIKTFNPGEVLDFKGYVHGTAVDGNDIWFVGLHSGGFIHSSGFTDTGTHDLPDLTIKSPTAPTAPAPLPPTSTPLTDKMIDISSHNEVADYATAKAAVRAVIAKAGHTGKSYGGLQPLNSDPTFATYKAQFGEKLVGAYWYGYPSLNPETEANAFLSTVGDVPHTFSYWLDIEEEDGADKTAINIFCRKFLDVVEKATGRKCGLYMNRNWFNTMIDDETKGDRPIWLAHYGTPEMSNPVKNQVAHQYTSDGTVSGFAAGDRVDLNAVTDAFFVPAKQPTPTPTTPGTPDTDEPVVVAPTPDPTQPDYVTEIKTVVVNMVVTFVQAFLGAWAATGFNLDKVVLAGAVGAAGSLVWNTILKPFLIKRGLLKP